jgi:hypothetical protein
LDRRQGASPGSPAFGSAARRSTPKKTAYAQTPARVVRRVAVYQTPKLANFGPQAQLNDLEDRLRVADKNNLLALISRAIALTIVSSIQCIIESRITTAGRYPIATLEVNKGASLPAPLCTSRRSAQGTIRCGRHERRRRGTSSGPVRLKFSWRCWPLILARPARSGRAGVSAGAIKVDRGRTATAFAKLFRPLICRTL